MSYFFSSHCIGSR